MSHDKLLQVMADRETLVPEAAVALDSECAKRGLNEANAGEYRKQAAEAADQNFAADEKRKAEALRTYRKRVWPQRGIFIGGALLTAVAAEYIFGLRGDAVRLLTKMLLGMAVAASVLPAFGAAGLRLSVPATSRSYCMVGF